MTDKTIFLVYGWNEYEMPCEPIKAFESESEADQFLSVIREYQETKPQYPVETETGIPDEDDAAFFVWADNVEQKWVEAHPAGHAHSLDGFDVMTLQFVSAP